MSKFFFNHNPATVEDGRLVKYAEIIYGEGGRSVLENLMGEGIYQIARSLSE